MQRLAEALLDAEYVRATDTLADADPTRACGTALIDDGFHFY